MAAPMPAPFLPSMMPPTTAPDPAPAPMMIAVFFHERFGFDLLSRLAHHRRAAVARGAGS